MRYSEFLFIAIIKASGIDISIQIIGQNLQNTLILSLIGASRGFRIISSQVYDWYVNI